MSDPQMPDLNALLGQAMQMQAQLAQAQAEAAETLVEGQAGGGAVTISVTGGLEFREVRISPDAVDPDDVELLQDLVLAALHDAMASVNRLQQASMGGLGDLLGAGGAGGGGLDGLLGLGAPADEFDDDEVDDDEEDDDEFDDDDEDDLGTGRDSTPA